MKKNTNFKINCQIYPKIIHVFCYDTLQESKEQYEKIYKSSLSVDINEYDALVCYPVKNSKHSTTTVMLLSTDNKNLLYNIHHESIHCAIWILHKVGVEISFQNDEAITYLSTYIFKQVVEGLKLNEQTSTGS